jgi:alpha-glucosidase
MQWDNSNPQADFSTTSKTWLPVPGDYKTINVQSESADSNSLLNWYKHLIHLRRDLPALHDGGIVMLDTANSNVLSYLRTSPAGSAAVVVSLNMSNQPQVISLDLAPAGVKGTHVKTLMTNEPSLTHNTSLTNITLPPYSSWVATIQ